MPFSVRDVLLGLVVPFATTLIATRLAWSWIRSRHLFGIACSLSVMGGFLLGYRLLELGPTIPRLDRDWVPYTTGIALLPAMIPNQRRLWRYLQFVLLICCISLAAWKLVPTWPNLEPSRLIHIVIWSVYTFALSTGMLFVARTHSVSGSTLPYDTEDAASSAPPERGGPLWVATMTTALATAVLLLMLSGSLRFAQTAGAGTAAFAGLITTLWLYRLRAALDSLGLVYSFLICGMMLTGQVNSFSNIPTVSYVMLPLAASGVWGLTLGYRRRAKHEATIVVGRWRVSNHMWTGPWRGRICRVWRRIVSSALGRSRPQPDEVRW